MKIKLACIVAYKMSQKPFETQTLSALPLLEIILQKTLINGKYLLLKHTAIVYIHHALQTSVNLLTSIVRLGAQPKNIFVLGKKYSECSSVVKQISSYNIYYHPSSSQIALGEFSESFIRDIISLWKYVSDQLGNDVENVLILDHGGNASRFIPLSILRKYRVLGVEKTTAGLIKHEKQGLPPFPIIGVAHCAAKKILESPLIAEAIAKKILPIMPQNVHAVTCGVIGYGAIGKAVTVKLLSMGNKVLLYDTSITSLPSSPNLTLISSLSGFMSASDYIFGYTGQDSMQSIDPFIFSEKNKTLISCSSEDIDFLSLLKLIQRKNNSSISDPFSEIHYRTDKGATIRVVRGGFPVNFDPSGESVPKKDIQLTRALVLGSVLQAIEFFDDPSILNKACIYTLDPKLQRFIVTKWLKC